MKMFEARVQPMLRQLRRMHPSAVLGPLRRQIEEQRRRLTTPEKPRG